MLTAIKKTDTNSKNEEIEHHKVITKQPWKPGIRLELPGGPSGPSGPSGSGEPGRNEFDAGSGGEAKRKPKVKVKKKIKIKKPKVKIKRNNRRIK